jgi:hypothetical protein
VPGLSRAARRVRAAAVAGLVVFVLAWLVLGAYQLTRIRDDGIAILGVTIVVASGLAALVRFGAVPVTPGGRVTCLAVCGLLLLVPLAFPIGLTTAWALASGLFAPAHSPLLALHLGFDARAASAYGLLVSLPALVGCAFVAVGTRQPGRGA